MEAPSTVVGDPLVIIAAEALAALSEANGRIECGASLWQRLIDEFAVK